ncbi:Amidohydrolase like protein [Fusarium sp. LHS14.1]|nr:Amidohydrolase like protein [Fusarium sp. LHS14.1]
MSYIDVHCHFIPPEYRKACEALRDSQPDEFPLLPAWSPEDHLDFMKQNNISKSIISISTPGPYIHYLGFEKALALTEHCNDYASELKIRHPDKFGFWASLPLPDVSASLQEIDRAERLGADGFVLMTNYAGHYLGDEKFNEVFQELNSRKATVFIHPTTPRVAHSKNGVESPTSAAPLAQKHPSPVFEFIFESARMVANLFLSGTMEKIPNVTFILPHFGGALPTIVSRLANFSVIISGLATLKEDEVLEVLRRQFYSDLAGFVFPNQFPGLSQGLEISAQRMVYGSDYPFTPPEAVERVSRQLDVGLRQHFSEAEVQAIYQANMASVLE